MPREGLFSRVIKSGTIKAKDLIVSACIRIKQSHYFSSSNSLADELKKMLLQRAGIVRYPDDLERRWNGLKTSGLRA